jgi:hypothetical protein
MLASRPGHKLESMDYPVDFPSDSRAAVEAEKLRAGKSKSPLGRHTEVVRVRAMNPWKKFQNDFKALMDEEDRIVQQRQPKEWLYAYFTFQDSGELGSCSILNNTSESLLARFELLATEAGLALGSPPGTSPLEYWLHCLFLELRASDSGLIRVYSDVNGILERLCEASAIYCARLDRRWLEKAARSYDESPIEHRTTETIAEPGLRRGYRTEVRRWMGREGVRTIEAAAHRLGTSVSALKSMMSKLGQRRYSEATLARVLEIIGHKGE